MISDQTVNSKEYSIGAKNENSIGTCCEQNRPQLFAMEKRIELFCSFIIDNPEQWMQCNSLNLSPHNWSFVSLFYCSWLWVRDEDEETNKKHEADSDNDDDGEHRDVEECHGELWDD